MSPGPFDVNPADYRFSVQFDRVADHIGFLCRPAAGNAGIFRRFLDAVAHMRFVPGGTAEIAPAVDGSGGTEMTSVMSHHAAFFAFKHVFHGSILSSLIGSHLWGCLHFTTSCKTLSRARSLCSRKQQRRRDSQNRQGSIYRDNQDGQD
jgi:hypothetical protein